MSAIVLVVEDSDDIREMLAEVLRAEGFQVLEAENGAVGLALLESTPQPPRVVLLDLMMPVMSGLEFLQRVQHDAQLHAIPVVVLSAAMGYENRLPDGVRFLSKPYTPEVVVELVRELSRAERASAPAPGRGMKPPH